MHSPLLGSLAGSASPLKRFQWQTPLVLTHTNVVARAPKRVVAIALLLLPLFFLAWRLHGFDGPGGGGQYYDYDDGFSSGHVGGGGGGKAEAVARHAFIARAMEVEYPGPFDEEAVREVCGKKAWRSGLILSCDHVHGGIGNVRNHILNCVRYAIEAGGALVVPRIAERNASDIHDIYTADHEDMAYLFDRDVFLTRLPASCPQLRLFERLEDFPFAANVQKTLGLVPRSLEEEPPVRTGLKRPGEWRKTFDEWLGKMGADAFSETEPLHVKLGRAYLEFPIYHDGEAFALNFGKILSLQREARYLTAVVLWELRSRFGLAGVVAESFASAEEPEDLVGGPGAGAGSGAGVDSGFGVGFFGSHIRAEKDAVQAWPAADWPYQQFDNQSRMQLEQIRATNLSVVYVACGDREMVGKFAEAANQPPAPAPPPVSIPGLPFPLPGAGVGGALGQVPGQVPGQAPGADPGSTSDPAAAGPAPPRNLTVVTKYDLLRGKDLRRLERLTFDQQGLVDFMVMMRASRFAGIGHSSFSWNIALRRHELSGLGRKMTEDEGFGAKLLDDGYSVVLGYEENRNLMMDYQYTMWP